MAKDRAAPFSRKHKRYWLPVTGGMVLIGVINLALGIYLYKTGPKDAPRPKEQPRVFEGYAIDAGVDAPAPAP